MVVVVVVVVVLEDIVSTAPRVDAIVVLAIAGCGTAGCGTATAATQTLRHCNPQSRENALYHVAREQVFKQNQRREF